jgi:hypothetical protein
MPYFGERIQYSAQEEIGKEIDSKARLAITSLISHNMFRVSRAAGMWKVECRRAIACQLLCIQ